MRSKEIKTILGLFVISILFVMLLPFGVKAGTDEDSTNSDTTGYVEISSVEDLQKIRNNPSGNYIFTADIDLSEVTAEGGEWDNGNGWLPIEEFSGVLDGNGYRIIGMNIFGEVYTDVGFFSSLSGTVRNLGLVDVSIDVSGDYVYNNVGGLAGCLTAKGCVSQCYVTGKVGAVDHRRCGGTDWFK